LLLLLLLLPECTCSDDDDAEVTALLQRSLMQFINKKKRQDQKKREKEIQVWACQDNADDWRKKLQTCLMCGCTPSIPLYVSLSMARSSFVGHKVAQLGQVAMQCTCLRSVALTA
jgi:hypothetical protein